MSFVQLSIEKKLPRTSDASLERLPYTKTAMTRILDSKSSIQGSDIVKLRIIRRPLDTEVKRAPENLTAKIESRLHVDRVNDSQGCYCVFQPYRGRAPDTNVLQEFRHFHFPRVVPHWIFPHRRFGRPHLRQHLVPCKPFDTVAAAQTFDLKLAIAAV